ncbi:MAG: leucyl/phenylalanyl-tRNA--protein transferase [Bacteroidota bacterium]
MLRPSVLLHAYRAGLFPMADPDDGNRIYWYAPDPRAVLPLDGLRVSRSLRQRIRRKTFTVTVDRAFERVIAACAAPAPGREETWISDEIRWAYTALHRAGYAHSVECWNADAELAGGLYGVRLGGAFFGESMFSRETDASKVALVHLVDRLRAGGFTLLDIQMQTDHLARMGAVEIPREVYERRLASALDEVGNWTARDAVAA